ncbi:MAG: hypothetical protein RLZ12_159 [Bacillota bacterium]|jgi:hypothetical protein
MKKNYLFSFICITIFATTVTIHPVLAANDFIYVKSELDGLVSNEHDFQLSIMQLKKAFETDHETMSLLDKRLQQAEFRANHLMNKLRKEKELNKIFLSRSQQTPANNITSKPGKNHSWQSIISIKREQQDLPETTRGSVAQSFFLVMSLAGSASIVIVYYRKFKGHRGS